MEQKESGSAHIAGTVDVGNNTPDRTRGGRRARGEMRCRCFRARFVVHTTAAAALAMSRRKAPNRLPCVG